MWVVIARRLGSDLSLVHMETGARVTLYIARNSLNMNFYYEKLQKPVEGEYFIHLPFRSSGRTNDFLKDLDEWLNGKILKYDAESVILILLAGLFYRSISEFSDWSDAPHTYYEEIIRRAKNAIKWRFGQIMKEDNWIYRAEAWIGYNLLTMLREFKDDVVPNPIVDEAEKALAEIMPYVLEFPL